MSLVLTHVQILHRISLELINLFVAQRQASLHYCTHTHLALTPRTSFLHHDKKQNKRAREIADKGTGNIDNRIEVQLTEISICLGGIPLDACQSKHFQPCR